MKAADQLLDGGGEESKATLRVIIDNMMYPITIEILHKVMTTYAQEIVSSLSSTISHHNQVSK